MKSDFINSEIVSTPLNKPYYKYALIISGKVAMMEFSQHAGNIYMEYQLGSILFS
jgi:hypothetical protein